jgi:hypothetical protein
VIEYLCEIWGNIQTEYLLQGKLREELMDTSSNLLHEIEGVLC